MKTLQKILAITLLTSTTVFMSCSSDDDSNSNEILLTEAELPASIKTYIETHFGTHTIVRAEKDTENNSVSYEIYLSENITLEFNSSMEIIEIDGTSQLPNSVIPQLLQDYVSLNYSNNFISDWELEFNHQQIELNNTTELEFDMNGNFIRMDTD